MSTPTGTKMLGRYELLFLLGQGGMGEVHLARLSGVGGFEKLCIVKTILPQMQADPQFVDRFHHEARVLVHLTHSNIAQVYDMGDFERTLYMAIEYVPGVDLSRVMNRLSSSGTLLPIPMALYIGQQITEALGYAHRKAGPDGTALGIVHRDVSPQNVMVSYEGEVKVIDFGLAKSAARSKHTMPSTVMGKLGYMSPEQAMARPVDHRSDIFSAGIVVWEMIAGRPLYTGATMGEMVAMMAHPTIPSLREIRPDVSPALDQVVMRALAADPANRYARCDELARALNELAVREQLTIGAEDVGNTIRAMCAEEFAAERQLQSKLSLLRKKNQSAPVPLDEPVSDGTFLRGSSETPLTPAQMALSAVATPRPVSVAPRVKSKPASMPSVIVGSGAHRADREPEPEQPAYDDDSPIIVPKSRTPLIVVSMLALIALGAGGYFLVARNAVAPVEQPVTAVVSPKPEVVPKVVVADEPKIDAGLAVAAVKRTALVPTGPVFKILHKNDSYLFVLGNGQQVREGQRMRLIGEPIDGQKEREVFGSAAVYRVNGSLAEVIIDEDESELPKELFAYVDSTAQAVRPPKKVVTPTPTAVVDPSTATNSAATPTNVPEKPVVAAVEPVKVAEPAVVAPTTTAAEQTKRRVILGDVRIDRRRSAASAFGMGGEASVAVISQERDTLTSCTVWLPNGRSSYFRTIESNKNIVTPLDKFKADERPMDKTLRGGQYALVQCTEGSGYFYFTNSNR